MLLGDFMKKFVPNWYSKSIYTIDLDKLKSLNIKYVLSDLDNTLVGYHVQEPTKTVYDLIDRLKEKGMELIVISNNNKQRLTKFCEPCALKFLSDSRKPMKGKVARFLQKSKINPCECAFVGDQLLTDMWCANKVGCVTILVEPLHKKESKLTFFNRIIDKRLRKIYHKKGKLISINKEE